VGRCEGIGGNGSPMPSHGTSVYQLYRMYRLPAHLKENLHQAQMEPGQVVHRVHHHCGESENWQTNLGTSS
jgi:hypothetical protein